MIDRHSLSFTIHIPKQLISFILLAAVAATLAVISCIPDAGTAYTSLPMILLWGGVAVSAIYYIFRWKLFNRISLFLLHLSFLVILAGAAVTHFTGTSHTLHLRTGEIKSVNGTKIRLVSFSIDYYPGTSAPRDFISRVETGGNQYDVSMNNVLDINGLRIFQTGYDPDRQGSTLTISEDSTGTLITYIGYALLMVSMLLCSFRRTHSPRIAASLIFFPLAISSMATPSSIPRDVADELGKIFIYHNDRIAPFSSFAHDFCMKLTGDTEFAGFSSEQILAGWLFYYDTWKDFPCIKIKDKATLREMNAQGKHVALTDFFDNTGYRFDDNLHPEANEKFSIASSASTGSIWRIFPYKADSTSTNLLWLSPTDATPHDMPTGAWQMTRHSLNYLAELAAMKKWEDAKDVIKKIARYQAINAGNALPSPSRVRAEKAFIAMAGSPLTAILFLIAGLILVLFPRRRIALASCFSASIWISFLIALNWFASGHIPLSNGYETMQWMALCSLLAAIGLAKKEADILPLGLIVGGLALMVAMIGQRNPQITQLMPVLRSPLLSIHVLAMMLAYALLALMALSGAMWLCGRTQMLPQARKLLRPAVFLLAAGIFIGAVWANTSWGRYWGWDAKEVWALITMIVYTFPLHSRMLKSLKSDKAFALWSLIGFLSVIMTYFGVNFILGGLHSYA